MQSLKSNPGPWMKTDDGGYCAEIGALRPTNVHGNFPMPDMFGDCFPFNCFTERKDVDGIVMYWEFRAENGKMYTVFND